MLFFKYTFFFVDAILIFFFFFSHSLFFIYLFFLYLRVVKNVGTIVSAYLVIISPFVISDQSHRRWHEECSA